MAISRIGQSLFTYLPDRTSLALTALSLATIHFVLKKISSFPVRPLSLHHVVSFVTNTYGGRKEEELDFAIALPCGVTILTDTAGKGDAVKRKKVEAIWSKLQSLLTTSLCIQGTKRHSQTQWENFLRNEAFKVAREYNAASTGSTFTMTSLYHYNNKKYVTVVHAGDNTVMHVQNDKVEIVMGEYREGKKAEASNYSDIAIFDTADRFAVKTFEVQTGDKIVAMTDGITKGVPYEQLTSIFQKNITEYQSSLELHLQATATKNDPRLIDDAGLVAFDVGAYKLKTKWPTSVYLGEFLGACVVAKLLKTLALMIFKKWSPA